MATAEQIKDEKRLQAFIQRNGLVSVMNNTKWENLKKAMVALGNKAPRWQARCLHESSNLDYWEISWQHHLPTYKCIEYLDIDPIIKLKRGVLIDDKKIDHTELITQILQANHIPFSLEKQYIRVWGYVV